MKNSSKRNFLKQISAFSISTLSLTIIGSELAQANRLQPTSADMVIVWKSRRRMALFFKRQLLKSYRIRLGFNPIGHKQEEGDGRTPEGRYFITHHNPKSAYHMSLGLNYPNKKDKKAAAIRNSDPGKDIFIHGGPKNILMHLFTDWTNGCIAVLNNEIEEIYKLVPDGTVVYIYS